MIGHHRIGYINSIEALPDWQALGVGLVVDCTGRIRLAALLASCVANLSKATGKVLRMPALPANVRYRQ